jgi:hypothetical protein
LQGPQAAAAFDQAWREHVSPQAIGSVPAQG